jgi:hypothetical protein
LGKYGSGQVDWIDVTTLMTALQGIHTLSVELTVTAGTQGHNGLLNFTVLAWTPTVEPQQTRTIAEVRKSWPDKQHATFDGAVFAALYELDKEIGKAYEQQKIE